MNKRKLISETKAIVFIVLTVLLVKVTVLEAYIVPTGSMENTIMTGDFLIGSRFVYGMRTPDWIGIPYTDIGFFIPYIKFPEFKIPTTGDVLIFKYPRDKYVKYVKRCVAGPGDTLIVQEKKLYVNGVEIPMWENGKYLTAPMQKNFRQSDIFLSSETNINKDNIGPIYVPKSGDVFQIHEETDWRFLLPIILMEGHTATLKSNEVEYEFTLQDPNELFRRKGKDYVKKVSECCGARIRHQSDICIACGGHCDDVYENYFPKGSLLTPWSKAIKDEDFQFLVIDGIPASEWTEYKVSQNYYWAMGDNRDNSLDSRYWGYIPENNILGEALFTYFSLDLDSWTPRWDRIGTVLR